MKKIAVIGAGISGLSISQLLKSQHEVTIFETNDKPGGMIRCSRINGHLFHLTGGHVFNTKNQDVLNWFWSFFYKDEEFTKANRNSVVSLPYQNIISYPIENHAYQLPEKMLQGFINDLIDMASTPPIQPQNFEQFLLYRFGKTLYREYFQPYNEKIWRCPLSNIPLSWLEGKLPMPTLYDILYNNFLHVEEKQFVHSSFYYPKNGGSQFIANRLAEGLNILYNNHINYLEKKTDKWVVNGNEFDIVIFCGNIKELPKLIKGIDISNFTDYINKLEYHGTTTVLCEIEENPYSWIYLPNPEYKAHRIICTGNFASSNRKNQHMSATVEFTDKIEKNEILDNLRRIPFKPKYLTHNYAQYTYPIQVSDTRMLINNIKQLMKDSNLYLLGRFAEWEYYNMDAAMGAAMKLNEYLKMNEK